MRNPSLTAFGGGGSPAVTSILRPSAGCPKVADLATIVGHVGTDVWADDPVQGIDVQVPATIGGLQARVLPLKAPPYSLVVGLLTVANNFSQVGFGLALRASASGKLWTWGNMRQSGFAGVTVIQWPDPNTVGLQYQTYGSPSGNDAVVWWRVDDDGVTRTWYASVDGRIWLAYASEVSGNYIVPDQAGIYIYSNGGVGPPANWAVRFFEFTGYK